MNKNKKSKLVIAGVISLAAVSVLTVGFSTWLVGVNRSITELELSAEVDNTLNESIFLEASISATPIKIAESQEHTKTGDDIIGASSRTDNGGLTVDANALKFTFATLKYSVGDGATKPTSLKLELVTNATSNSQNYVESSASKLTSRTGRDWTYLALDMTIDLSDTTKVTETTKNGYKEYEVNEKTYSLSWGTFFNQVSPVNYYNSLGLVTNKQASEVFEAADNIYTEISAMKTALVGNMKVNVSLQ